MILIVNIFRNVQKIFKFSIPLNRTTYSKVKMKVIILYAYLVQFLFIGASVNTEIENVYIDALIQRYKILENNLWNFIKENRLAKPNVVVDKIITEHQAVFMEKDLEELMMNDYKLKFQFFYEIKSFKNCTQEDRLLKLLNESQYPSYISEILSASDSDIYCVDRVSSYYRKKAKKLNEIFGVVLKVSGFHPINRAIIFTQKRKHLQKYFL